VTEVWLAAKSEAISKERRTNKGGAKEAEAHSPDEKEVDKTRLLSHEARWLGDQQEDKAHYRARIQALLGYRRDILLRHEINSGEAAYTHLGE
jgi:hypothetical protein